MAAAGKEQPGEGRSKCAVPCDGNLSGNQSKHPEATRWGWWWCPIDVSSGEKEGTSEEVTRPAKTLNLKELKQAGRKQIREEKMQKKGIKMTADDIDKANTKPVMKQVNLLKNKEESYKAPTKMNKARIELRNTKTDLKKVPTYRNRAARVPVTNSVKRLTNAKGPRLLKKEMASSAPQTPSRGQDSFPLPLPTKKTGHIVTLREVFTMRGAVAVLLFLHMILVEVFGYIMFTT